MLVLLNWMRKGLLKKVSSFSERRAKFASSTVLKVMKAWPRVLGLTETFSTSPYVANSRYKLSLRVCSLIWSLRLLM